MSTINRANAMNTSIVDAKVCVAKLAAVEQQNNLKAAVSALIVAIGFVAFAALH